MRLVYAAEKPESEPDAAAEVVDPGPSEVAGKTVNTGLKCEAAEAAPNPEHAPSASAPDQLAPFRESMKEFFSDYREEMLGIEISEEFYDYFEIEELDPDDYNNGEYDYSSKAKAKLACKAAIMEMISDVQSQLVSSAKEYLDHTRDYYSDLKDSFDEFFGDLSDAYDSCAETECDQEAGRYLLGRKKEFFSLKLPNMNFAGVSGDDVENIIAKAINTKLPVRDLLQECDYEEDDDYYCYFLEPACDRINSETEDFVSELEDELPRQIYRTYQLVFLQALQMLETRFDETFASLMPANRLEDDQNAEY